MPVARATNINEFIARKSPAWERLEHLLLQVESSGLHALQPHEVREFGVLYRRAASDLVSARSKTANADVLEYLNDLVARGYAQVYRSRPQRIRSFLVFFLVDYPRLVRHCWRYVALASLLLYGSAAFGWIAVKQDRAAAYHLLPPEMARNLHAIRQKMLTDPGHEIGPNEMSLMSTGIMTNNIGVSFLAFALGITAGVGTIMMLIYNGLMVGALAAGVAEGRAALGFWSLILPHGIIELTAITFAGAAGLLIGSALIAPGQRSRVDALVERGRLAVLLILGIVPMLVIAGLIEGFITPPIWIPPIVKLIFAAGTGVALAIYMFRGGRGTQAGLVRELTDYAV